MADHASDTKVAAFARRYEKHVPAGYTARAGTVLRRFNPAVEKGLRVALLVVALTLVVFSRAMHSPVPFLAAVVLVGVSVGVATCNQGGPMLFACDEGIVIVRRGHGAVATFPPGTTFGVRADGGDQNVEVLDRSWWIAARGIPALVPV